MDILKRVFVPIIVILFFFVALFVYTKFVGPIPFKVNQFSSADSFIVTGEGKVQAKPDAAIVHLGVVSKGITSKLTQDQLNTNINKVTEAIQALGVSKDGIKTENYNIYPEYGEVNLALKQDSNNIVGYSGSTTLTIKVADTDLANKIIDAGTANGANMIGGVEFELKNDTNAINEARKKAVEDAKKKAVEAARAAGFKLGRVVNYSESEGGDYPVPMLAKAADRASGGAPTEIQPGTNEVSITVTLSYEIK